MTEAKGRTGTVSFDGQFVTIKRMMSKQERRLAVASITAVQFRPATAMINGFGFGGQNAVAVFRRFAE